MKKDNLIYLTHISESLEKIVVYTAE